MMRANFDWPGVEPHGSADTIPDLLLPVQFTELLQRSSDRSGEQRLMAAVLEEAMRSFCQWAGAPGMRAQRLFGEAAEWFASDDVSWPFAFENVCHALALDPEWIRRLLRRWLASEPLARDDRRTVPSIRRSTGGRHLVTGRAIGLRPATRIAC